MSRSVLVGKDRRRHPSASLSERAYSAIRERIFRGELRPGAELRRRQLATELKMSLLPVSTALQRLESDGLIETRPRVGTRVRVPTLQDIREHHVVREGLESQSARLFVENASHQERQELLRMAEHMDILFNRAAAGDRDPEFLFAVHNYHFQLHLRIAECTGCGALRAIIERNHVLEFNWLYDIWAYDVAARAPVITPRFHRDLVEVLVGDDPEAADAAMRHHIRSSLQNLLHVMELTAQRSD